MEINGKKTKKNGKGKSEGEESITVDCYTKQSKAKEV